MSPEEVQGVILFYIGLSAVGLAIETGRAFIWIALFWWFYKRVMKKR